MIQTYNPIQGPFDSAPKKAPGTVIVVLDSRGVSLHASESAAKRPPPLAPAAAAPAQSAQPSALSSGGPSTGPLTPEAAERLGRLSRAALTEGSKLAVWGSKKLLEGAQRTSWGAKLFGSSDRSFYLVDISRRPFEDEFELASKDSTLYFTVTVNCDVQVSDPCGIVHGGITDIRSHFNTRLKRLLGKIASDHTVQDLAGSRAAMQAELDAQLGPGRTFDPLIAICEITLDVRTDETAAAFLRTKQQAILEIDAIDARGGVDAKARKVASEAMQSPETMLAQWLQSKQPEHREAYERMVQKAATKEERRWVALKFLLDEGVIERQDIYNRFPDFAEFMSLASTPATAPSLPAPEKPDGDK
jgi:hypothetical protein